MATIREEYVPDKDCKHSIVYKPKKSGTALSGMSIYVPRTVLGAEKRPDSIFVTLEIPE